jgi:hypothetical protein
VFWIFVFRWLPRSSTNLTTVLRCFIQPEHCLDWVTTALFRIFRIYQLQSMRVSQSCQINSHHSLHHIIVFLLYKVLTIPMQYKTRNFKYAARSFTSKIHPRRISSQASSVATPPSHDNQQHKYLDPFPQLTLNYTPLTTSWIR